MGAWLRVIDRLSNAPTAAYGSSRSLLRRKNVDLEASKIAVDRPMDEKPITPLLVSS